MKKLLLPVCIFLMIASVIELFVLQEQRRQQEVQRRNTLTKAGELRGILQSELNSTLYLATGLVSYIQANNGEIVEKDLPPWLESLTRQGKHIRNIGLAPGNRLTYIYPLEGNEAAIGLYYPDNPRQWPDVKKIIQTGQPILAGPLTLVQGGQGLIYRVPVYLNDGQYWGLVSTVINADQLLEVVSDTAKFLNLSIALRRDDPEQDDKIFFRTGQFALTATAALEIHVPGSVWHLDAAPADGGNPYAAYQWLETWGLIIAALIAGLSYLILRVKEHHHEALKDNQDLEMQFTSAFEMAPVGMLIVDADLCIESSNAAFCSITGLQRSYLCGQSLEGLFAPEALSIASNKLRHALRVPAESTSWEAEIKSAEGDKVAVNCHVAGIPSQNGRQTKLIVQINDIREHKRLEQLKNQFVSTVSHELRTPITSIGGALAILANTNQIEEDPDKARQLVTIAARNSKRLEMLINDLLDLEKIATGMLSLMMQRIDAADIVEHACTTLQPYAEQYEVRLIHTLPERPAKIEADASRLEQVLANFLSNAIKFSPTEGTVQLQLAVSNEHARFSVIDQGPGIPASFQDKIFSRFSQVDSSDSRARGGTGLGLAISKDLVEKMGGSVGFNSVPGVRTEFYAEFPTLNEELNREIKPT